ncbi:nuclear transport factor 2 family protein [Emticicia sp. 17c]|uniref:nuclear transport factor 2 family protein n=1 Tax=Emticicia sp. 17c TaxID=3127704 RepID=UPI00301C2D07
MKKLFTILFIAFSATAFAQTDEEQIKASINQVFDGMRKNDTTLIRQVLHPSCFLKSVLKTKTGEVKLQDDAIIGWLKSVGTKREGVILDERLTSYDIKVDGAMAMAWTPYELYVSDKFIHCGVDLFTLMKTEKGWQIIGIVDTRRKENCKQ